MNSLFSVKERILLIVTITESNGLVHCEIVGVMVVVAVGDRSWRAAKIGGPIMKAWRDALHDALRNYFPDLKKVEVPQGGESQAWDAIVNGYHQQISPVWEEKMD